MKILKRQEDSRGWIEFCEAEGQKFNILFSKAGSYRSGDYHPNIQHDLLLFGEVKVHEAALDGQGRASFDEEIAVYGPNHNVCIPRDTAHLFHFQADTLMIEWWDGEFEFKYYPPYRSIVEESLK